MLPLRNVFSCFDGMSCGQISLNECGVPYKDYYASEIDKAAMSIANENFKNTVQVGDINKVNLSDFTEVDLVIGGSPCQGFSINGNRLNFNDKRSLLLFKFIEVRNFLNPHYWLFENVATMSKEIKLAIDEYIGVRGIYMNSNLFSPQNRKRIYWTNIQFIRPEFISNKITFDILEDLANIDHLRLNDKMIKRQNLSRPTITDSVVTINPKMFSGQQTYQQDRIYDASGRYVALTATLGNRFNVKDQYNRYRRLSIREQARMQTIPDNITFNSVSPLSASAAIGNGWTIKAINHIFNSAN